MPDVCELCKVSLFGAKVKLDDPFKKTTKLYHYKCFVELALKQPEEATCKVINIKDDFPFTW